MVCPNYDLYAYKIPHNLPWKLSFAGFVQIAFLEFKVSSFLIFLVVSPIGLRPYL